jgi:hypothetical protein
MEEESNLEELKKDYAEIQSKYGFPSFDEINQDFGLERVSDIETDLLVREVRKYMSDKLQNYMRFVETILHPSNASIFIFSIIKTIKEEDKKTLTEIYKKLARYEVDLIELDVQYSEEKEAKFVNDFFKVWQEVKKDMLDIVGVIKSNWDNEVEKGTKAYFG